MAAKAVAAAACGAAVALSAAPARAASDVWRAAVIAGNWETGTNWTDNTTPGTGDTATFNSGGSYTVTFGAVLAAIQALTVSAGDVIFRSSGATRTLNVNSATGAQDISVSGAATTLTLGTAAVNAINLNAGDDLSVQDDGIVFVHFGSDLTAADFSTTGLNGVISVSGAGSTLALTAAGAANFIGRGGNDGYLILDAGSTGNSIAGRLGIAESGSANSVGSVLVAGGSSLTLAGNLTMADQNIAGQMAELQVDGASSSFTQSGASTITVGAAVNGTATINVGVGGSGATFTGGSGLFRINATGTVSVGSAASSGTLNAGGNVLIDGGVLQCGAGSAFNLPAAATMTVQNGGRATFASYTTAANATYSVTGSTSKLETTGGPIQIRQGGQVNVIDGDLIASGGFLDIGTSGAGSLSVSGIGALAQSIAASGPSFWGSAGGTANVTFSNGAQGIFGAVNLASSGFSGTTTNVTVQSGAVLSVGTLSLTGDGGATASATLNVQGAGSAFGQSSSGTVTVGHASSGTAVINIGTVASGASMGAGTLLIKKTGTVNVGSASASGELSVSESLTIDGGVLQFEGFGSTLSMSSFKTITIANGGTASFGGSYTVSDNITHNITGAESKLQTASSLSLFNAPINVSNGGTLDAGSLNVAASGAGAIGRLTVTGGGSTVSAGNSQWGQSGDNIAIVTFSDNASGTFGTVDASRFSGASTVRIESGADVNFAALNVARFDFPLDPSDAGHATVTVTGAGSTVTATSLSLGHAAVGAAILHVRDGAALTVNGGAEIRTTGQLNVDGGTTTLNGGVTFAGGGAALNLSGGALNIPVAPSGAGFHWSGGTLHVTGAGGLTAGAGGPLGAVVSVSGNAALHVDNGTTIDAGGQLQALGPFLTGALSNGGQLNAIGSTVTLASASSNAAGARISLTDGTLNLGSGPNKLTNNGRINLIDATVNGEIESLAGGIINTAGNVTFNGNITGGGSLLDVSGGVTKLAAGGTRVVVAASAELAGQLDLTDNKLVLTAEPIGSFSGGSYNGVTGLIQSGRNGGNWDGEGIVTSDARAIGTSALCSLGVATAGQAGHSSFAGQSVASDEVLVMFTYGGDANLDGKINIDDYGRIDGNVGQSNSVFGWFNGDFNYDGKINIDDYGIIDGNINAQGAPFATAGEAPAGVAAVPEPAGGAVLVMVASCIMKRRRGRGRKLARFCGSPLNRGICA